MWIRKLLPLLVFLLLSSSGVLSAEVCLTDPQYESLRMGLLQAQTELESIKLISVESQQDLERVRKLLKQREIQINSISKTLTGYKQSLQNRNEEIESLLKQSETFKKDLVELQDELTVAQELLMDASKSLKQQETVSIVLGSAAGILLAILIGSLVF